MALIVPNVEDPKVIKTLISNYKFSNTGKETIKCAVTLNKKYELLNDFSKYLISLGVDEKKIKIHAVVFKSNSVTNNQHLVIVISGKFIIDIIGHYIFIESKKVNRLSIDNYIFDSKSKASLQISRVFS